MGKSDTYLPLPSERTLDPRLKRRSESRANNEASTSIAEGSRPSTAQSQGKAAPYVVPKRNESAAGAEGGGGTGDGGGGGGGSWLERSRSATASVRPGAVRPSSPLSWFRSNADENDGVESSFWG
jgi:hypothetical protein